MSVERPTFSELWFRVAGIHARLRTVVQIGRQDFRGQLWYVVQDDTSNQYYRLSRPAYEFVARLDGTRTVADVWMTCCAELGDEAITQPEVIQLLGNLYSANLLQADIPPDAAGLFKRYESRKRRELESLIANFLYLQVPVFDPNVFLDRTVWLFGKLFTWWGGVLWALWLALGGYFAIGRAGELWQASGSVLDPNNLPLLYVTFTTVKILHELGHAMACKKFGQDEGKGGEVHAMGIMLMISVPYPYVDVSSAWALRNKWHRIVVGAAGMIVELAIASLAAILWAKTAAGTTVHAIAYNVMWVSGVSTLLFNGNPLLRYDAYYMLSDWLEIPNLAMSGREYVVYLVHRWVWGVRTATTPVRSRLERFWLFVYFFASTAFRMVVVFGLFWVLANRWFVVGALLAASFVFGWTVKPLIAFGRYLSSCPQLHLVRGRAALTSGIALALVAGAPLAIVTPEYTRLEGIAEPREIAVVHARGGEVLTARLESGTLAKPDATPLVEGVNEGLTADLERFRAALEALVARKRAAQEQRDTAFEQAIDEKIAAMQGKVAELERMIGELTVHAPFEGTWISPEPELAPGAWVNRGQQLGVLARLDRIIVRAPADQQSAARILANAKPRVEIRVRRRPDLFFTGTIEKIHPAGDKKLPSMALGYAVGGSTETEQGDRTGVLSKERTFQVVIKPDEGANLGLLSGQRVVVRFELARAPLARQWWDALMRMAQRRFNT